ncbi:hypothetical protein [Bifidobacterium crudilactis]|jgi:hypothetical protein|uniref:Uncharacterized protein n=1 Tax=Bifidobacterium crudilactis TaxID=327277 RepID=A0A971D0D0_9BIFI|nr:hypothetical protein [Bifidobacterium crudilactis]MCI1869031.1 hypothetical protein [Bifidobacterium crudilactis]NLT80370.1 hypothetical protein [Bifidobacterium crudilactis]
MGYLTVHVGTSSVLDYLWNSFLARSKPDALSDEQLVERATAIGVTEQWISAYEWQEQYLKYPERVLGLLNGHPAS